MVVINSSGQIAPLAVSSIFIVIIALSLALRFYAKRLKKLPLRVDDYLISAAAVFTYGLITCDIVGVVHGGVGRHVADIVASDKPGTVTVFFKDLVAIQMLWATSLMFVKLSILFFYMSIFDEHPYFRITARFVMGLVILWCLTVILCGFFLCRPFAFNWNQSIEGGNCGDQVKSYIITGALNICTDIMVLGLPLPIVWKLHAPLANRIALLGLFAIGFFVCIISILRMRALLIVNYKDITFSVIDALIWSMLEPALGIALACAPVMRPVFRIFRNKNSNHGNSGPNSIDVVSSPKRDSKNFQKLQERGIQLGPVPHNRPYSRKSGALADDVESQKSSRSESELVPVPIPKVEVKTDWAVRDEQRTRR